MDKSGKFPSNYLLEELEELRSSLVDPPDTGQYFEDVKPLRLPKPRLTYKMAYKMYSERNHDRPHFHVDYNNEIHTASIAIDKIEVLAGNLPTAPLKETLKWAEKHKTILLQIWNSLKSGETPDPFIRILEAGYGLNYNRKKAQ